MFIITHTTNLAHDHTTIQLIYPTFISYLLSCLTVLFCSLNETHEDTDKGANHQEQMMVFMFVIMFLSSMDQHNHLTNRKRKLEEDKASLSMLISAQQRAHNARYIVPCIRRDQLQIKAETFNRWFHKTDGTWLTVVSVHLHDSFVCSVKLESYP